MTLHDIVIESVETAGPSTTAEALAVQLEEADVGSIVIEEDMQPVGMVTDRDLAVRVDARDRQPSEVEAADIMTPNPTTVPIETGLLELTDAMCEASVRRMPVLEGDELVGIVTLDDVMRLLSVELANLASVVEDETPPY